MKKVRCGIINRNISHILMLHMYTVEIVQQKIAESTFLDTIQKEYFQKRLVTLSEDSMQELAVFLTNVEERYKKEQQVIEAKYVEELKQMSTKLDKDFLTAKRLVEMRVKEEEVKEEHALLNSL